MSSGLNIHWFALFYSTECVHSLSSTDCVYVMNKYATDGQCAHTRQLPAMWLMTTLTTVLAWVTNLKSDWMESWSRKSWSLCTEPISMGNCWSASSTNQRRCFKHSSHYCSCIREQLNVTSSGYACQRRAEQTAHTAAILHENISISNCLFSQFPIWCVTISIGTHAA